MKTMHCRSCGDYIAFITTPAGKSVPVDPDLVKTFVHPTPTEQIGRQIKLVTERGQIVGGVECSLTVPDAVAIEGYVSHFATCSDPKRWRRG